VCAVELRAKLLLARSLTCGLNNSL
jgi:hypothetical protein